VGPNCSQNAIRNWDLPLQSQLGDNLHLTVTECKCPHWSAVVAVRGDLSSRCRAPDAAAPDFEIGNGHPTHL